MITINEVPSDHINKNAGFKSFETFSQQQKDLFHKQICKITA